MRFLRFPFLLSALAASLTEALLLPTSSRKHRSILTSRAVSVGIEEEIDTDSDLNLDFAPFDDNCFPGRDENEKFRCDPSVEFWRKFQNTESKEAPSAQDNIRDMVAVAQKFLNINSNNNNGSLLASSSYFGRHLGRIAYFTMNAVLGDAAYQFSKRLSGDEGGPNDGPFSGAKARGPLPMGMSDQIASRLFLESLLCYEQDYFDCITKGIYREPWDMATLSHRQSNPINAIAQTSRFVREAVGTLGRRSRGAEEDKLVRFFSGGAATAMKAPKTTTNLYPDYYQTAFHYQGDGWMSTDSANVYETSTETLFLGRQDSMQRTSLPALVGLAEKFDGNASNSRPMRVLEVACGTGRFMTFVRDNLPLDTEYTAVDLSPFYLEKASDNDSYWRRTREQQEGSSSTSTTTIAPSTLVQAQAEALPFPDDSFDAVVCVYLFHELPRHVRAKAAAEMARVVCPGGTVVLTDSVQKGDRPPLDQALPNFQKMNEPFYVDYVNDDLGAHFEAGGLIRETKIVRSTTKSLSFSKPGELSL